MERKVVVPFGMLSAAGQAGADFDGFKANNLDIRLAGALRWLSENPIVPTDEQFDELANDCPHDLMSYTGWRWMVVEWQRRMFLEPEPEAAYELGRKSR